MLKILPLFLAQFALMTGRVDTGFFSQLDDVITALRYVDQGTWSGLEVSLQSTPYCEKGRGDNWWTYYFEPLSIGSGGEPFEVNDCITQPFTREEAHWYIEKYIKIKPHVLAKVDEFIRTQFQGHTVIGVHYRGTDKMILEAPRVSYEKVLSEIIRHVKRVPKRSLKIFVATDERPFLNYLRSYFGASMVLSYSQIFSENGEPIHLQDSNSYQKGEEALIDALLLSKGDLLLRTQSNLSRWSTYFNPDIPVFILNN